VSLPYHEDDRQKPPALTEWELTLRMLAWPVVLGAAIGFGLAISLFTIHRSPSLKLREKAGHAQVLSREAQV
jgi:hypothetical protein